MRKSVHWKRDPVILERLTRVQPLRIEGRTNTDIARIIGVDEITIRRDVDRLAVLWLERLGEQAEVLRAEVVAELNDNKQRSLSAAQFDEMCERAVLFGEDAEGNPLDVERPEKGAVSFRGNKAASLSNARQAVMDKAKVLGLIIEKQEHSTPIPVRTYEVDITDGRSVPLPD